MGALAFVWLATYAGLAARMSRTLRRRASSMVVNGTVGSEPISTHGYDQSIEIRVPPLAAAFYVPAG